MNINDCYNFDDFRKLAKKKLPAPIFHYIDGGADDEVTLNRNTDAFNDCDLVPNILASVGQPDLSTTVLGTKIDMPLFLSPTAMQRLYHHEGDKASARAAEKFGTFYSMSTMATSSIEQISNVSSGPKLFQLYIHKDQSLTDNLIDRCKSSGFKACMTQREIKLLLELQRSLIQFIACRQWHLFQLKRLQMFLVGQNFFNFIFTKINQ